MSKGLDFIPHNKPYITNSDIDIVADSLGSMWLAPGNNVLEFEKKICKYINNDIETLKYQGVAVSSGTAALYLALCALEVKQGDEVILPTYSCTALLNAINLLKAVPILVDIDSETWNISYERVASSITDKTKAIIITHTFGVPADIESFRSLGIPIIEDCAQALGSSISGNRVGTFGDISVFSFYATKMITTGHGGMLVSSNSKIINKIRDYVDFDGREYYYPRFNFQMTDFQASLGLSQLSKLDFFINKRKSIALKYNEILLNNKIIKLQNQPANMDRNFYRYVLKIEDSVESWNKIFSENFIKTIIPIEKRELLHRYLHLDERLFQNAENIANSTISLPIFPLLKEQEVERICEVLKSLVN